MTGEDLRDKPDFPEEQVDYELVKEYKDTLFRKAFAKFQMSSQEPILTLKKEFDAFCLHTDWLPDYAMFMAIKKSKKGAHWLNWEKKYRKPTKSQKAVIERELYEEICYEKFLQWLFFRQWTALKEYANEQGILSSEISRFLLRETAPTFGRSQNCSSWIKTVSQLWWPEYRRIISVPPDSSGEIHFTTGSITKKLILHGG